MKSELNSDPFVFLLHGQCLMFFSVERIGFIKGFKYWIMQNFVRGVKKLLI